MWGVQEKYRWVCKRNNVGCAGEIARGVQEKYSNTYATGCGIADVTGSSFCDATGSKIVDVTGSNIADLGRK